MTRAVNDATLQKAGDIYQYLIALRDCFELNDGDTLQIETNGDVSIINDVGGRFQGEVKHHFGNKSILLATKIIFLFPTIRFIALIKEPSKSKTSTTFTIMPFFSLNPFSRFKKSSLSNPTS